MFLQTSKDLLNLVIALAILGFTFFSCWAIYYFIMILRQVFKSLKEMRQRLQQIDEVIKTLKEKIEHSTSYLLLIVEAISKLAEVMKEKGEKWIEKKKKTKK